jgi:hypothetical protein
MAKDDKKKITGRLLGLRAMSRESELPQLSPAGLTLDSLMEGSNKDSGVVQKTMRKVAEGQATSAPLARTVSARAQRKVHYEDQSSEVSR